MSCSSASYIAGQSCRLGQLTQFKSSLEVLISLVPDSAAALGILNETASLENISLFLPHTISHPARKCVPQCKSGSRKTMTSLILFSGSSRKGTQKRQALAGPCSAVYLVIDLQKQTFSQQQFLKGQETWSLTEQFVTDLENDCEVFSRVLIGRFWCIFTFKIYR